jgi:exoribonuclease R
MTSPFRVAPIGGPARNFTAVSADAALDFASLRHELGIAVEFPSEVLAQAQSVAAGFSSDAPDRTDIPFVTVDPPGARDLDQALHIAKDDDGYLVSYAIADVASYVAPGTALDDETRRRGETLYFPDVRVPLHPAVLSEGAASLLPDQVRAAVLWQITLDATGLPTAVHVSRARVRSTAQLDYAGLQSMLDAGTAPDAAALLPDVGRLRLGLARQRHAINLDLPEQEVVPDDAGGWKLQWRAPLPVESWNAEISLLTGMCAGDMMLEARIGLLRTLPAPDRDTVRHLARLAPALNVTWPAGAQPGDVLAGLDRTDPRHTAFLEHAASLLRGAGYTAFDATVPAHPEHAGVGAVYAHVTAPLRRLVDRFATEVCLALAAGTPVPDWARTALPSLPDIMAGADHRAHEADRAVVDTVEAWLLREQLGHEFDAVVLDARPASAHIAVEDPPIRAGCDGSNLTEGARIRVRLTAADVAARQVRFAAVQ